MAVFSGLSFYIVEGTKKHEATELKELLKEHGGKRVVTKLNRKCVVLVPHENLPTETVSALLPFQDNVVSYKWAYECVDQSERLELSDFTVPLKKEKTPQSTPKQKTPPATPVVLPSQASRPTSASKRKLDSSFSTDEPATKKIKYCSEEIRAAYLKKKFTELVGDTKQHPNVVAYALDCFCGNYALASKFLKFESVEPLPWQPRDDVKLLNPGPEMLELVEKYGVAMIKQRQRYLYD